MSSNRLNQVLILVMMISSFCIKASESSVKLITITEELESIRVELTQIREEIDRIKIIPRAKCTHQLKLIKNVANSPSKDPFPRR
jgi:hypothetical protein